MQNKRQVAPTTEIKTIYLLGIGGTGVGALAGLLKTQGYHVLGSDTALYPPMSDKLAEWGITPFEGYSKNNIASVFNDIGIDLVVVGNVIRRDNPEAYYMRQHDIPHISMPEAVARFGIGTRHSFVVAGTHGKTSTSALLAHALTATGYEPGFLVGGAMVGYRDSFCNGGGDFFVIEGDEYDTAYFDKGPKFLHYKAQTAIITSIEFDHADIFDSIEQIEQAFAKLLQTLPSHGHAVIWRGASRAVHIINQLQLTCKTNSSTDSNATYDVTYYDLEDGDDVTLYSKNLTQNSDGIVFEAIYKGGSLGLFKVPVWGEHSVLNVLSVIASLYKQGVKAPDIARGLESFKGVKRRLEVIAQGPPNYADNKDTHNGENKPIGIVVVDDFGHHPTAIKTTLAGAKERWPQRRIWAIFEPRSATNRRNTHQETYVKVFMGADRVIIADHERLLEIPTAERFNGQLLALTLTQSGTPTEFITHTSAIVEYLKDNTAAEDILIIFSNGDFDGLHKKLAQALC